MERDGSGRRGTPCADANVLTVTLADGDLHLVTAGSVRLARSSREVPVPDPVG